MPITAQTCYVIESGDVYKHVEEAVYANALNNLQAMLEHEGFKRDARNAARAIIEHWGAIRLFMDTEWHKAVAITPMTPDDNDEIALADSPAG